jgi:hypothetical protein
MAAIVRELLWALIGQDRAVANARRAATEISRRRVERHDVELYLESLTAPRRSAEEWSGAPVSAVD